MSDPADPTVALRAEIDRLRESKRTADAALAAAVQERDAAKATLATASQERDAAKQSATAWEAQGKLAAQLQTALTAAEAKVAEVTAVAAAQLDMVGAGVHDPTVRDYLLHTHRAAVAAAGDKPPAWEDWWAGQKAQPSALLAPFLAPAAPALPPPGGAPPPAPGAPPVAPPAAAPAAPPPVSTGPSNTTLLNVSGRPPQLLGGAAPAAPAAPPAPGFPANAAAAPGPDGSGVYRPGAIVAAVAADPAAFAAQAGMPLRHPERFANRG